MQWAAASYPRLRDRGRLAQRFLADLVVFDPARIGDHATFEDPHTLTTGVEHVLVNGVGVLAHGEHTIGVHNEELRQPEL